MNHVSISRSVGNWLRRQSLYLGVAAAVYAVFWAISQTVSLRATLIYSFCLGNLASSLLQQVGSVSCKRGSRRLLLDYLTGLLLSTPVMVTLATALVFWADGNAGGGQFQLARFRTLFWDYLRHGWKFPAVATLIFGAAALLYRVTKDRLENSNRELQDTVNLGAAERESQEQELQRAREIQRDCCRRQYLKSRALRLRANGNRHARSVEITLMSSSWEITNLPSALPT